MSGLDTAVRVLEYVILVNSVLASLAASYVLADYVSDRLDLGRNGAYRMTANIGIRTSAMIAFVFLLFATSGLFAVLGPPPAPGREVRSLISLSIFEAIVLTLTALKLLNLRDRIRLRRAKLPA